MSRLALAAALLAAGGVVGCTAVQGSAGAPPDEPSEAIPLPSSGELEPGTYLVTGYAVPFEITVPDGWESFGWGVLKANAEEWEVFVNFLEPDRVATDGCAWRGTLVEIEPTPEAYAAAMAAQTSTETTSPVEITMGEYVGLEFQYSVEEDVDITECTVDHICLFANVGDSDCGRVYSEVTEQETERIIDLEGQLTMFAVGEFQPVDPSLTDEAQAVFDSITFVSD
ncbi:hypothetical protein ABZ477_17880 [Microbacterium sp. NPDC019599]|uniref:hypothetical protein n=1 Tax=Microbacterium sp. NPDC019599 TaxID=3154690 RepID=UPI0033CF133A